MRVSASEAITRARREGEREREDGRFAVSQIDRAHDHRDREQQRDSRPETEDLSGRPPLLPHRRRPDQRLGQVRDEDRRKERDTTRPVGDRDAEGETLRDAVSRRALRVVNTTAPTSTPPAASQMPPRSQDSSNSSKLSALRQDEPVAKIAPAC